MRRRRKDQNGEYNYWQPATDMMTGLVFVLMLIVALLGLYLLSDYTGYKYDETEGVEETTAQETRPDDDGWSWKEYKGNGDHEDVGDGAGDGGGSGQEQPIIQTGGGGYGDEGIKSAVFTELVDDETDRIIPDEGVRFELYRTDWGLQNGMGALQILNTYYPEKISYREYETTEEGVFYLPEKIYQGDYFFRELNEPEGYDAAGDTYFNLDKMYDWPDPFVVQIRVSPSKNVIRVQMSDLLSKDPVGGGTFQVRAAEDVATLDGTVRYIAGQLVDTITCDENGYGESKELYLGSYTLEQAGIPRYYAGINEQPEALVEKKNGEEPPIHEIDTEKTKITLKLSDELYQQQPLSGAVFTVTNGTTGVSQTVETDQNGQILLTDLDKNTSYKIRQQQTIEDYQLDPIEYTEDVDAYGRINGENQAEMDLTNRMLRISVHGTDMILRKDVADIQLSLYDSQDQLIESWVSGESGKMFTNLKEGSYYVLQGDDGEKRYDFTVADTAQVQNWNVTVLTLRGILTLAAGMVGGTVVIILLLFAGITLAGRRKKEDKKKDSEKKTMNGVQIRVGDLLYAIGKRWKMILAFVLVGCGFGAALSGISYVQGNYTNYRINCSIAVTSQSETGNFTGNSSYFNPNDFYLAQDMVDAVGYVMKSERVLREAAESVRIVDPDPVAIARNLDIERYNETQIIEISLKWHDADTGIRLMNAILDTSREVLPKTLMVGSVSTIDEPQAEYIMGMGGLSHIWLITGVMGFIMGAGMAMLELIMRPTLLNLKDVENVFGLETMGIIPNDQEYFRDGRVILEKDGMTDSAVRQNFTSAAYILQNRLGLKDETCSFYVTSAEEGEGKSTVAANLAVQLSDMEKKVLLVDLNTRNPRLGSMFLHSVDYSRTLNALYKGETDPLEAVISLTGYLDLLPSVLERNAIPMDGQVFDFIRGLEKDYDYVIIDTPSVGQVSDVLSLNQIAQAVLFVIRYDDVALPMIQNAIDKLDKSGIRILGCVVNAAQKTGGKYFGGERNVVENRGRKPKKPEAETMKETMDDLNDLEDMMKSAKETQALKSTHPHTEEDTAFNGLLEELTDDLLETSNRLSNQEAIEALVQMGMNESGREESQEELENEDTEQSETDPEQSEQP